MPTHTVQTGTLFSMANFMNHYVPNFIDIRTKKFEGQVAVLCGGQRCALQLSC